MLSEMVLERGPIIAVGAGVGFLLRMCAQMPSQSVPARRAVGAVRARKGLLLCVRPQVVDEVAFPRSRVVAQVARERLVRLARAAVDAPIPRRLRSACAPRHYERAQARGGGAASQIEQGEVESCRFTVLIEGFDRADSLSSLQIGVSFRLKGVVPTGHTHARANFFSHMRRGGGESHADQTTVHLDERGGDRGRERFSETTPDDARGPAARRLGQGVGLGGVVQYFVYVVRGRGRCRTIRRTKVL